MSEQITVYVGSVVVANNGHRQDDCVPVSFEGEQLGQVTQYETKDSGAPDNTRGVTQTLYRTSDDRLVVHVEDWSRWQGEPNTERLVKVTEADLQPGGKFARLGRECGYGRDLTLDEGLALWATE